MTTQHRKKANPVGPRGSAGFFVVLALFAAACAFYYYRHAYVPAKRQASHYDERRRQFSKEPRAEVVVIGDSFVEYADWRALLGTPDAANLGISGDTVPGVRRRVEDVYARGARVCVIMAGSNDFPREKPSEVLGQYAALIDSLSKNGISPVAHKVVYVSRAYSEKKDRWGRAPYRRMNAAISEFNAALESACASRGVPVVDLNARLAAGGFLEDRFTSDGRHLNLEGYRLWAEEIRAVLRKMPISRPKPS